MKKYCLDTNIICFLCNCDEESKNYNKKENIKRKIIENWEENIFITDISIIELIIWMDKKIHEINKKYLDKVKAKKLFKNTFKKDYEKFEIELSVDKNEFTYNEKLKIKQFEKQNSLIKFFVKNNKVLSLNSKTYEIYKKIIFSWCLKGINFKNQDQSDLLIACINIENNIILITENEKDFNFIEWLNIENWTN